MSQGFNRYPPDLKPFQSIGYLEIIRHLHGTLDREAMILRIQQRTRQYAKRQMTWFRKEPGFRWLSPEHLSAAQDSIQEFLDREDRLVSPLRFRSG